MSSPAPDALSPRVVIDLVLVVLKRPDLWWAGLGALRRMAAPGWWKAPPYLPLPAGQLWAFRMVTAYGDAKAVPVPADLVSYLQWCRGTARSGR
jgi:hypothetical protein